jgi:GrpB-like predicted nucleotidyltransferase (UPF0157 family)
MAMSEALGLEHGTVRVVPHDERWHALFDQASTELKAALGSSVFDVHHVGSTSVWGLCAKPILDMLVTIPSLSGGAALVAPLQTLGYVRSDDDDISDRLLFARRRGTARTHHLSLAEPTSHYYAVTIAFRDALRRDPELASRYGSLKQRLALQFPTDRLSYLNGKTHFVLSALEACEG